MIAIRSRKVAESPRRSPSTCSCLQKKNINPSFRVGKAAGDYVKGIMVCIKLTEERLMRNSSMWSASISDF